MVACSEYFHFGDDFDAALAISRSYRYGAKVTKALTWSLQMKKNAPWVL